MMEATGGCMDDADDDGCWKVIVEMIMIVAVDDELRWTVVDADEWWRLRMNDWISIVTLMNDDVIVEKLSNIFTDLLERAKNAMMMDLVEDSCVMSMMVDVEGCWAMIVKTFHDGHGGWLIVDYDGWRWMMDYDEL